MDISVQDLALRQLEDYRSRTPGTYFGEPHEPLDLDQAYELQATVARLRIESGDEVAGYKVGCTGPSIVEQFGMRGPIRAFLFRSEFRCSGDTLDHTSFARLAIEGEMAVQIGEAGEIAAVFPIIELHNFVFRGVRPNLVELVANNGINAGVVLPPADRCLPEKDWAENSVLEVKLNGTSIDSGGLWPLPGGISASVGWLRGNLKSYGLSLSPGQLVLLGTPLGLHSLSPGDHVVVGVNGREHVECYLT